MAVRPAGELAPISSRPVLSQGEEVRLVAMADVLHA
jgi:hypothetical protein